MADTDTTDFPPMYLTSGYEDSQSVTERWCISNSYSGLKIPGLFIFVCLCGLVGNMVVMRFLGFHKKNPFTVYVLNLAIADSFLLLFLLAILALYIYLTLSDIYFIEYQLLYYVLMVFFLFMYYASMYLLTAMSIERCLSVLFPIWYQCHCPKHLSGIICAVLWVLAALFVTLSNMSCNTKLNRKCDHLVKGLSIVNFLIFCLLPLLSNLSVFIRLRCGSQRRHPGKLYVAILLNVIFMFIFGLPPTVMIFLDLIYKNVFCLHIGYLLASVNSSINPVIYFLVGSWRNRRIQGSMKVALRRLLEENVTSEES